LAALVAGSENEPPVPTSAQFGVVRLAEDCSAPPLIHWMLIFPPLR
jgi:hypothetical protein